MLRGFTVIFMVITLLFCVACFSPTERSVTGSPSVTIAIDLQTPGYDNTILYIMSDNDWEKIDIDQIKESVISVVIGEGVTVVPAYSFECCTQLQNVNFPKSLKRIEEFAFAGCENLTSVYLPKGVQEVMFGAFSDSNIYITVDRQNEYFCAENGLLFSFEYQELLHCPSDIGMITINEKTEVIGAWAFAGGKLTSVELPQGLRKINSFAFYGCVGLTEILLPNGLEWIGEAAFSGTSLIQVELPPFVEIETKTDMPPFPDTTQITNALT